MRDILYSTWRGALTAGIFGVAGAVIAGGVTALFSGPVALAAGIAGGLFGLFGAAGAALDAATAGRGDYRGAWLGGVPVAAALAFGIPAVSGPSSAPPPQEPAAITETFNAAGAAAQPGTPLELSPWKKPADAPARERLSSQTALFQLQAKGRAP